MAEEILDSSRFRAILASSSTSQGRFARAMTTTTGNRTALPIGTWQLDAAHSQVGFAVEYMVGTFRGTFSPVDGKFEVAEDGTATLSGRTEAASVKVQDENLEAHLQTPDFFDAERTPELAFAADEIVRDGDNVTVKGELTIRGVEQPIELHGTIADPITDPYGRERIGLKLEGTVDRTSFGLNWNNPLPSGEPALANDVSLSAELYFVKA
jgi:polyisoprenoid-binding protein YceI